MRNALFALTALISSAFAQQVQELEPGIYPAVLTPLREDLSCDGEELFLHCQDLVERGCKGVALFGTTGEGPLFSLKERKGILRSLVSRGFEPHRIILGNGGSGIQDTVKLAKEALRLQCAAMLIVPPGFYSKITTDEGVIAYYREIIQRVANPNLRVILYHIPQLSGVAITPDVIAALREEFPEQVIGLKESEGNLALTHEVLAKFPGFKVFVGSERQIIEAVSSGGSGSICGIANFYPELICSLFEKGLQGSMPNPSAIEEVCKTLKDYPFLPAAKAMLEERRGEAWHTVSSPLVPLDTEQRQALIAKMQRATVQ